MSVQEFTQKFEDFSGGWWGKFGSFGAAENQARLINMQVYANGSIGPRPGWKLLTTTGTAPNPASASTAFYSLFWVPDESLTYGYLVHASANTSAATARLNLDTLAWSTSTLGSSFSGYDSPVETNGPSISYLNPQQAVIGATRLYNTSTDTAATITYPSSFAPKRTVFYKERLYAWGDATYRNRVYYSDAGAFSTFTAGNYFDIGSGGTTAASRPIIYGAWALRNGILFYLAPMASTNANQAAGEWWILEGATPLTGTLRRIAIARIPTFPPLAVEYNNLILAPDFHGSRGIIMCDGANVDTQKLDHLRPGGERYKFAAGRNAAVSFGEPSVIFPFIIRSAEETGDPVSDFNLRGVQAFELVHGAWTQSLWWGGAADVATASVPFLWATVAFGGYRLIAQTNTSTNGSGEPKFFSRDICLDRPSSAGDTWSSPLEAHADTATDADGLVCQAWLPEIRNEDGRGVRIRRVTVEFDYWSQSIYRPANTADMTLQIRYISHNGERVLTDEITSETADLADTADDQPSRARYTFLFDTDAFYGTAQVRFTSVRNCAFHRITVDGEWDSADPQ